MAKATIRDGIEAFLSKRGADSSYLIPKWNRDLESQYIVHEGSVEVEGSSDTWTDGEQTWGHHRWPRNAGTNPNYKDQPLTFSPGAHLKRIGSTWWNYKTHRSVAVALDIDLEGEHAQSTTTVTESQLKDLVAKLQGLDYITLVKSSGGNGVHIYCFFNEDDQPNSVNHNEHTQVAKSLVAKISADLKYDLSKHMDAVGVVFWFWSCDSPEGHTGYDLIHQQTRFIGAKELGPYADAGLVGPNVNIKIDGYNESGVRVSNTEIGGGYKTYPIESDHTEILKELEDMGFSFIWQKEFNMAHTHTVAIKKLYEKRKEEGRPLKGIFETISKGADKSKPNCYMTPRPDGVFQVKRFGTRTAEHCLWQSRDDDTWCYLNQEVPVLPVFKKFSSSYDGSKLIFEVDALEMALNAFGHTLGEGYKSISAPIIVMTRKDGTMWAKFKGEGNYEGWKSTKEGLVRDLPVIHKIADFGKSMLEEADQVVRHVVTPDYEPFGWALKCENFWTMYPGYDPVACVVQQMFGKDAAQVRSEMTKDPWVLHHLPFGAEYPGGRLWNKRSAQLSVLPSESAGPHPTWDRIFDHLGSSLDDVVSTTPWCQQWGLSTGADYLRVWLAALIRYPLKSLPYLFFYGPQNAGKSVFHESLSTIFTCGVMSAKTALCSGSGYNQEIANVVLGHVEEKDLSVGKDGSYDRIKEWVTAKTMLVHKKGHTPYNQPNTLHLVQMANKATACPMEDGDTRITAILVRPIVDIIPETPFFKLLKEEAPFFVRSILTIDLPESHTRLRVPMLASEHKKALESMSQTPFENFCEETIFPCSGQSVKFGDFYIKYSSYCTKKNTEPERRSHVLQLLCNRGDKFVVGLRSNKQKHIANFSFHESSEPKQWLTLNNKGRLIHV